MLFRRAGPRLPAAAGGGSPGAERSPARPRYRPPTPRSSSPRVVARTRWPSFDLAGIKRSSNPAGPTSPSAGTFSPSSRAESIRARWWPSSPASSARSPAAKTAKCHDSQQEQILSSNSRFLAAARRQFDDLRSKAGKRVKPPPPPHPAAGPRPPPGPPPSIAAPQVQVQLPQRSQVRRSLRVARPWWQA